MDRKGPEKKERLVSALEQGMVMIHLDARRPGVLVPSSLKLEPHLRLNLSYRFDPPDLAISDWGIRSTLSFAGNRYRVAVPWSALFAITSYASKEFWMYPDDMPRELIQQAVPVREAASRCEKGVRQLREVGSERLDEADRESRDKPSCVGPHPHLRVVK